MALLVQTNGEKKNLCITMVIRRFCLLWVVLTKKIPVRF